MSAPGKRNLACYQSQAFPGLRQVSEALLLPNCAAQINGFVSPESSLHNWLRIKDNLDILSDYKAEKYMSFVLTLKNQMSTYI